jgi:hypothetical protein
VRKACTKADDMKNSGKLTLLKQLVFRFWMQVFILITPHHVYLVSPNTVGVIE